MVICRLARGLAGIILSFADGRRGRGGADRVWSEVSKPDVGFSPVMSSRFWAVSARGMPRLVSWIFRLVHTHVACPAAFVYMYV